jgi:glycosyltransferase involved in cell wall biosynthesis
MLRISTVIPAYNSAHTIHETLTSILSQTRRSDEVIVVDDGSTDNTEQIVKRFEGVTYLRQLNSGVSAARNAGVAVATGDWVAFCDADDVWHPDKLNIVEQCIEKYSAFRFLFHNFCVFKDGENPDYKPVADDPKATIFPFFKENKKRLKEILPQHEQIEIIINDWSTAKIFSGNAFPYLILGNFILPSSVTVRRDFYLEIGGFDIAFKSAEETEFFLRAAKYLNFNYIDMPLTAYRKSAGGLTGNIPKLLNNGMKALFKNAVEDRVIFKRYRKEIELSIARRYGRLASYWLVKEDRSKAITIAVKGIKYHRNVWQLWTVLLCIMLPVHRLSFLKKTKTD